jgi:tetratricopeptide (TPR) repeat protein
MSRALNISSSEFPPQPLQVATLIQQGLAAHQQGRLKEAQAIYEQILAIQPHHFDALQLSGTLSVQTLQYSQALEFFSRALEINADQALCHNNCGAVYIALKRFDEALQSYDKALAIQPDYVEAHYNRGKALKEIKRFEEALSSYDAAISFKPDYADAHYNRGNTLLELQRFDEALASYEKALTFMPQYAEALYNRGLALEKLNRIDEALQSFKQAVAIKPNNVEAYFNLASALMQLQRIEDALLNYDKAIAIKPDYAEAYSGRGLVLHLLKRLDEAVLDYDKAIAIKPDFAVAHNNRANLLLELKRFDEALAGYDAVIFIEPNNAEAYCNRGNALKALNRLEDALQSQEKALAINPDYARAYSNRGVVLHELSRSEEALLSYDKAHALVPDYADAHYNRGIALKGLKRLDEAAQSYEKAIAIKPDYTNAHWNLGLCHLLAGNFHDGFLKYEWRWNNESLGLHAIPRAFDQPLWLGDEALKDKTILLYAEQGFGDTIHFCRYASLVADLGAHVILEVQPPLVNLLTHLQNNIKVIAQGDKLPAFDYQCPLMSLPLAFKTELHSIPASVPYLKSNKTKVSDWQVRLGEKTKPRVGVVWSGSAVHRNDHNRSLSLAQLLSCLPSDNEYISLQKEIRAPDKRLLAKHPEIQHFGDSLQDFTDTAALCELMDFVISVDTSVAHLAGALGKKTYLLLPFLPDWRWLLDRDDSPWYPTFKLYRQQKVGDWAWVLEKLKTDLASVK